MGIRWLIGSIAFLVTLPVMALGGLPYVVPSALLFFAWAALGAYLDAERWRARARR